MHIDHPSAASMLAAAMRMRGQILNGFALAVWLGTASFLVAQTTSWEFRDMANGKLPFSQRSLPYAFNALEPHIDARTLVHHWHVHGSNILALDRAIGGVGQVYGQWNMRGYFARKDGELLVEKFADPAQLYSFRLAENVPDSIRSAIRENGQAHFNHSLYWQTMRPGGGGEPSGALALGIKASFGSFSRFKRAFTNAALARTGNGWAWLTLDNGRLKVETTSGEESPLASGRKVLLGLDLWDHAYQPQYGSNRAQYVSAWFNVVDWHSVSERYRRFTNTKANRLKKD